MCDVPSPESYTVSFLDHYSLNYIFYNLLYRDAKHYQTISINKTNLIFLNLKSQFSITLVRLSQVGNITKRITYRRATNLYNFKFNN